MQAQDATSSATETESIQSIYLAIRNQIEQQRDQVYAEIRSYSPPIPACDVQFNTLLEIRSSIAQELSRLNSWSKQPGFAHDRLVLLNEFIMMSTCLQDDLKQTLRMALQQIHTASASEKTLERLSV